jgi:hypothetical protein
MVLPTDKMMASMKSARWLGVFLSVPIAGFAAQGWTDYATIEELTPISHGHFLVRLKVSKNPTKCKNKEMFCRAYRMPGAQHMYVKLENAVASSQKVRVHVTGRCELNGYSEISSISIQPE